MLPLIKNKTVPAALSILENTNKKAALHVHKAIRSAAANARRLPNINENDLYVSRIFADGGPMLKRFRAQAMGMAAMIRKKTSHLVVELDVLKRPVLKKVTKAKKPKKMKKVAEAIKTKVARSKKTKEK